MKKNFVKLAAFAVVVSMVATSCDNKDDKKGGDGDETTYVALTESELPGITFSATDAETANPYGTAKWAAETAYFTQAEVDGLTLEAMPAEGDDVTLDGNYKLTKSFTVADGQTLTIKAGTVIVADGDDVDASETFYIMVCQGGQIIAEGTEAEPIVMTVKEQKHGAWGGLHICGKAKMNAGDTGSSEIGEQTFGGTADDDNSGVLQYVRIEYAGQKLDPETEANGFTFYAVGSGTTVENCCAFEGADDGFEFFGGAVECEDLVSIDNQDDSFDWTYGFTGAIKGAYAKHLTTDCDHLIEGDNNSKNAKAEPISNPTITDAVLVGQNSDGDRGVRLRRGSRISMDNVSVSGKTNSFDIISEESVDYFRKNTDAFADVKASGKLTNTDKAAKK